MSAIVSEFEQTENGKIRITSSKNQKRFMGMGASSILMVLLVLYLITFAILALVSAVSDYRMTERLRASVLHFYEGDAETDRIIMEIDKILISLRAYSRNYYTYAEKIAEQAGEMENVTVWADGSIYIYTVAGEGKFIETVLNVSPFTSKERYIIISRRVVTELTPEEDEEPLYPSYPVF
jgi:hypothetical protein